MKPMARAAVLWMVAGSCLIAGCESGNDAAPDGSALPEPSVQLAAESQGPRGADVPQTQDMPEDVIAYEGVAAGKRSFLRGDQIAYEVLILDGIDEATAINGRQGELERLAAASDGAWYAISREQFDRIRRGQRLAVSSPNEQLDSLPPRRVAHTIDIVQDSHAPEPENFRDDVITGSVLAADAGEGWFELNITDWANRHTKGPVDDVMHRIRVHVNAATALRDEQGQQVEASSIRIGDRLDVVPEEGFSYRYGHAKEPVTAENITLLQMTRKEKLRGLLAQGPGGIHTVVLHEAEKSPSPDPAWSDLGRFVPGAVYGGYSSLEYPKGEAVDLMQALELDALPAFLVFDREDLLFRTGSVKELQRWFNLRAAEQRHAAGDGRP